MTRMVTPDEVTIKPDGTKSTRITVKAICPQCHRSLGDATAAEIHLVIDGIDVVDAYAAECGYLLRTTQQPGRGLR